MEPVKVLCFQSEEECFCPISESGSLRGGMLLLFQKIIYTKLSMFALRTP